MEEVVASMTVTIRADWINWMKGLDDSEDWRKLLDDLCTEQHIGMKHDGNVIRLSGNFKAIKDVRTALQDAAKQASEKKKTYESSASIDGTTGLEEKFNQMKIADPEGPEKKEDTQQKRKRILKVKPELSEGEKAGDVVGSHGIGSDNKDHHDSSSSLIQIQLNQNQSTESKIWDDDKSVPTYTPSDHGQIPGQEVPIQNHSYPSEGLGQVTGQQAQIQYPSYSSQGHVPGHQGPMQQHSSPSQGQGTVTVQGQVTDQGQTEQHSYTSQGQRQVTVCEVPMQQNSYPSQGQRQVTVYGVGLPMQHNSFPSQGQRQVTVYGVPMQHNSFPSQGQRQVTVYEVPMQHNSYPSQGQGQVTVYEVPMQHNSYPSQGQGQVTGHLVHQAQVQPPSYSSQSHVTGPEGMIQQLTNPVIPGPSPLPLMYKQFLIKRFTDDSLHFTSNRTTNVLNIFVHKGNIVDQRTQILVSSANCQLTRHGNVSEAILTAAGQSIVDECSQIIRSTVQGFLPLGDVVPTKAGNLGPHVETILHAIVPTPQEFLINPVQAFNTLSKIFFNCLCMSAGQTKSVSFPAIGSEIFGLQRMVEAFICGLRAYDQCASSWPVIFTPGAIHFISKDPNKLKTILEALYLRVA